MKTLQSILFLCFVGLAVSNVARVKVGAKRWAYHLEVNGGQNVRKEYNDEDGVTHGTFTFVAHDGTHKHLVYKFDLAPYEPDIFWVINQDKAESASSAESSGEPVTPVPATNGSPPDNSTVIEVPAEPNYESIERDEDFSGHVSVKAGKGVYVINFLTGDKSSTREETLDENGLLYGKYTYFDENKSSKVVVNYKFNSSGSDPMFEFSMYKKNEPNRQNPLETESNTNTYYDANRLNRRILMPASTGYNHPYARPAPPIRPMPSVTLQNTNPPHNLMTPMQGNWYYRAQ